MSKSSSVSRICKHIDADVAVLRNREPRPPQRFVYVWLDATYVHVREARPGRLQKPW